MNNLRLFASIVLAFFAVSLNAQKINLITQTQPKPTSPKLNQTLRTDANGAVQWVASPFEVVTGSTPPPGGPTATQANIYVSPAGVAYTWNGSAWNAVSTGDNWGSQTASTSYGITGNGTSGSPLRADTSNNGLATAYDLRNFLTDGSGTKLNTAKSGFDWNGTLGENVTIRGLRTYSTFYDSVSSYRMSVTSTGGNAVGVFSIQPFLSSGVNLSSYLVSNPNRLGNVSLTSNSAKLRYTFSTLGKNEVHADETGLNFTAQKWDGTVGREIFVDTLGYFFPQIETATNAFSRVMVANPSTGEAAVSAGPAPSVGNVLIFGTNGWEAGTVSGGGGISTYSAGNGAIVTASGAGVTFTRTTASQWTVNVPTGVELLSVDINNNSGQSATAALDIDIVWAGSRPYNQDASADMTDLKAPVVTTVEKINPGTYPTPAASNNPAWTLDVTSSGTLRISTAEFSEVGNGGANATSVSMKF